MAEPQPSTVHEGASDAHAPTSTAEDRKAAAALSTLDATEDSSEKTEVDGKALDKAMKGLHVDDKKKEEEKKKAVKVEAGDIALLVSRMDSDFGDTSDAMVRNGGADMMRRFRS